MNTSRRPKRRRKPDVMNVKQWRATANEHSLQASVVEYLNLHKRADVHFFAIPNAGKRSWITAARFKAEGLTAGVADLCIMFGRGKVAWMELKVGSGKQSEGQLTFESICRMLDHPYSVAHTFDKAIAVLRLWGAFKPNEETQ